MYCMQLYAVAKFLTQKIKSLHNTLLHETHKYTVQGPDVFGGKTSIPDVSIRVATHSGTSVNFI